MNAKIFAGVVVGWSEKCEIFVWFCLQDDNFETNTKQSLSKNVVLKRVVS